MSLSDFRTDHLLQAAERFTPSAEMSLWVATKEGVWSRLGDYWRLYRDGEVIDTVSDDEMREFVIEQLEEYKVTDRKITQILS